MLKDFRDFIVRGNLIELAVAFVIGAAFATVIASFVTNLLMPLVGKIGGRPDFSDITVGGIPVGQFVNDLVVFLLIAAAIYFVVVLPYNRLMERFKKPHEVAAEATSEEIVLLREIRDLMARREDQP
ncbi:MAG: large conductance mechanosensitive channel protein MscL [Nocardioidaceae bacterium]|nr:large conductance mechanosensitive channel protein MscL [Nocardioidaceae bacterium]